MSFRYGPMRFLLILSLSLCAMTVDGQTTGRIPVNVFGDGNPGNGIEDSRERVMGSHQQGKGQAVFPMNAGTIKCDGKIRGTAMVVDTREIAPQMKGVVLASAAHVIFDLEKKKRFKRCEFQFMALGELSGYRAKIDLKNLILGSYDPRQDTSSLKFGEGDWVFLYVPKPWKSFRPEEAISIREFSFVQTESFQQAGGEIGLVAFDSNEGVISVSRRCSVIQSGNDDLGGGGWNGQLLDDCDSVDGASGGGIIAMLGDRQFLIGIRSGSHWSEGIYPADEFPNGPPDGSVWDRQSNTNFGRAVDSHIMKQLEVFMQILMKGKYTF